MKVFMSQILKRTRYISCIVLIFSLMVTMLLPLPARAEGTDGSGSSAGSNFGVGNTPWYFAEKTCEWW